MLIRGYAKDGSSVRFYTNNPECLAYAEAFMACWEYRSIDADREMFWRWLSANAA